jgi:hypothetical protein
MHPLQLSRSKISHHARNDPINGISAVAVLSVSKRAASRYYLWLCLHRQ